jgi:site-specific DNA-methyltransferase (adenine-specific)
MYQESVMVPMGNWRYTRLKNLSEIDMRRDNSKVGSGFGKKISNWLDRDMAYPTNVINIATECSNKNHSAAFPVELPTWFIKLFTSSGDTVLDPFMGSGTTAVACINFNRNYIGIEINPEYINIANERINGLSKNQIFNIENKNKRIKHGTKQKQSGRINQAKLREIL